MACSVDVDDHTYDPPIVIDMGTKRKTRGKRTDSCPPRTDRSVVFGPWSLEWLSHQHHSEAGVVSSSRKNIKKGVQPKECRTQVYGSLQKQKKVNVMLRHSVHSLKKVAGLPNKDRKTVMQILKKNVCKFQGSTNLKKAVRMISKDLTEETSSSSSNNTDWKHWVVMHGSEKVVQEDVRSIRETIGVQFNGSHNMFGVLVRKGKGKKKGTVVDEGGAGGVVEGV